MPLKILLADDDITAQNMAKHILAAVGYDVVTVSNGVAALKKIAEVHPDIVLLDVHMAGYDGIEVCTKIKASAELAKIPIVLTVGMMEPFNAEQGTKVKADGLIVKPFNVANLITVIEKLAGPPPESRVSEAPVHAQPAPEPSKARSSGRAAGRNRAERPLSCRQGGEVCDVCGHVNLEGATVCEQCDVPLPSSVTAHITSHLRNQLGTVEPKSFATVSRGGQGAREPSVAQDARSAICETTSSDREPSAHAASASEDIGQMAGAIWHALNSCGECSLAQLKKEVNATRNHLFDWAIGWLAREDKIIIAPKKSSFTIRLK